MKNLKKAERIVIALTILCLFFTAGFFIGRGSAVQVISFERLESPAVSAETSSPATEQNETGGAYSTAGNETAENAANASPSPGASASESVTGPVYSDKININTALSGELDMLPGIGPVLAQSIIDYRENNGSFKTIEEIKNVDGIGDKKFEAMKGLITVG